MSCHAIVHLDINIINHEVSSVPMECLAVLSSTVTVEYLLQNLYVQYPVKHRSKVAVVINNHVVFERLM